MLIEKKFVLVDFKAERFQIDIYTTNKNYY